jgi:DNA-binding TFAR19-related protein (PDSD5 family)
MMKMSSEERKVQAILTALLTHPSPAFRETGRRLSVMRQTRPWTAEQLREVVKELFEKAQAK